jgi:uncharacterized membrane protein YwaF
MAKLILLSVVIMMVAIPVVAARDKNAKRGLQKAVLFAVVFNIIYVLALRYLYPHLIS